MTMKNDQITAQFNLLIRERDEYNKVAAQAERERRREEQVLSGHRSSAQQVADQLRVAQAEDGEGTRRLQNLKDAKDRLERQIEGDRAEMMKLTNELRGAEEEEKRQKWKFVREMEGLNDELDGLLSKEESEKTLRLIDTETVQWLVETKLGAWMNLDQEGIDENDAEVPKEKWREVRPKIETTLNALIKAREKVDEGVNEKAELEKTLVALRQKFGIVHSVSLPMRHFYKIYPIYIFSYSLTILYRILDTMKLIPLNQSGRRQLHLMKITTTHQTKRITRGQATNRGLQYLKLFTCRFFITTSKRALLYADFTVLLSLHTS